MHLLGPCVILAFCAGSLRLALSASKSGIFVVLIEFSAFCADQAGREDVVDTIWNLHEQPSFSRYCEATSGIAKPCIRKLFRRGSDTINLDCADRQQIKALALARRNETEPAFLFTSGTGWQP